MNGFLFLALFLLVVYDTKTYKMKKIILFSALFLGSLVFAQRVPVVGGDRDAHGCIPSAGYTYSHVKDDCIRVFEQKIKLKQVNPEGSSVSMAAVIFSNDKKKAEVFLPDIKLNSIILTRSGKGKVWKKGEYVLVPYNRKAYQLKKDNIVIYN